MENENLNCTFSDPVYWDNEDQVLRPVDNTLNALGNWNFQTLTCSGTSTATNLEMIQNAETGSEFYISKSFNYGDLLISFFLMILVIFGVFKFLMSFVIPKFMNFKRH